MFFRQGIIIFYEILFVYNKLAVQGETKFCSSQFVFGS